MIRLDEKYWPAINNLALVLAQLDQPREALGYAREAMSLTPGNPAVKHTLGFVLY